MPIDANGLSLLDKAEEKLFTSHASLKPVRTAFTNNKWSGLSLPTLRAQYGLESSMTWKAIFKRHRPSKARWDATPELLCCTRDPLWPAVARPSGPRRRWQTPQR